MRIGREMMIRFVMGLLVVSAVVQGFAEEKITIDPKQNVIVVSAWKTTKEKIPLMKAAQELQKHLALVTGVDFPIVKAGEEPDGHYPFHVGKAPEGKDAGALADQETRWEITPSGTYLYGRSARDTQYAVYGFLQDQLGISWIAPGDSGIVYRKRNPLTLRVGAFHWTPKLWLRSIRPDVSVISVGTNEFQMTTEELKAYREEVMQWYRRMRMGSGGRGNPIAGHAFSGWWKRFGETHPEYFALNKYGKRAPVPGSKRADSWIKICPGNPKVAEQIIADWLPNKGPIISVGVNDGTENFCECPDCRALDVTLKGEAWNRHLTDRYTVLANRVARLARKHREDVYVTMYAYMTTINPPRREKLEPNVIVSLVPYVDPLDPEFVRKQCKAWRKMGATTFALRPNYHHAYLRNKVIPFGVEKAFFDVFQEAYRQGCIAANYDCLMHNWPKDGIVDYILARSMGEPEKPFEHWAAQYYSAFGTAAGDVREYFEYWRRELWEKRLRPKQAELIRLGGGNFGRGVMWSPADKYYTEEDFEKTNRMLEKGATRDLTEVERKRLRQLQLVNEHARRTFQVIVLPPYEKPVLAKALMDYRREIKDELPFNWQGVISGERGMGDLLGLELIGDKSMAEFRKPWLQTDLFWKFKFNPEFKADPTLPRPDIYAYDPESQPEWHKKSWEKVADWDEFRTDRVYGQQVEGDQSGNLSPETVALMKAAPEKGYIGIGWYATRQTIPKDWKGREIYLRLGAVDESAWIYVNGRFAGKRIFDHYTDWQTPFNIRIDPFIQWDQDQQMIMVRVQNTKGFGGLWKRSWVVSK